MRLYIIPGACSLAVNIALREAGIRFELSRLDLETGKAQDGTDFRTVNPKGYVPALQEIRRYARNHVGKRLDYLHGVLRDTYLLGGQFTIADAYLFTVLGWGTEVGLDIARWPGLESYRAHIALRPHVVAALESEA